MTGYVVAGYLVTGVVLAGYWARLSVRLRSARRRSDAVRAAGGPARRSATAPGGRR